METVEFILYYDGSEGKRIELNKSELNNKTLGDINQKHCYHLQVDDAYENINNSMYSNSTTLEGVYENCGQVTPIKLYYEEKVRVVLDTSGNKIREYYPNSTTVREIISPNGEEYAGCILTFHDPRKYEDVLDQPIESMPWFMNMNFIVISITEQSEFKEVGEDAWYKL